ncbi:MAG: CRISPR-associated protein Cas4 [Clostridia bacterium]|nr:CRISPR-associated protein Cas4 [Clostridia bacterium]
MRITGTIINYYFHCKRQCYLYANRMNLEDNSEDVRIGKVLHEIKNMDKSNTEIKLDAIAIDKITDKYVVELKKSDSDIKAARMQVLLYLYELNKKGITRDGKLTFNEKNSNEENTIILLKEETIKELKECMQNIEKLLESKTVPDGKWLKGCKKCAYYEYCYL